MARRRATGVDKNAFNGCKLLLPMAFPEGIADAPGLRCRSCEDRWRLRDHVKAFFEMFEVCDSHEVRKLCDKGGKPIASVPNADGSRLVNDPKYKGKQTIQGELDKLAANISIGRNMADVHYYSD